MIYRQAMKVCGRIESVRMLRHTRRKITYVPLWRFAITFNKAMKLAAQVYFDNSDHTSMTGNYQCLAVTYKETKAIVKPPQCECKTNMIFGSCSSREMPCAYPISMYDGFKMATRFRSGQYEPK
jgi:hypothetical protein